MYHMESIDVRAGDRSFLYFDTACACANNMLNVANFYIRNLMTGLKKPVPERTANERDVIETVNGSVPEVNRILEEKLSPLHLHHQRGADDDLRGGELLVDGVCGDRRILRGVRDTRVALVDEFAVLCDDAAAAGGTILHHFVQILIQCSEITHTLLLSGKHADCTGCCAPPACCGDR